jgi:hypothetical protein
LARETVLFMLNRRSAASARRMMNWYTEIARLAMSVLDSPVRS